ncbi:MAG: DUF58 domain-containing protein [Lachnospiraceae bacterium]|nr:DUF58 domain-containing protein [Lachnospiraceae bacterium]
MRMKYISQIQASLKRYRTIPTKKVTSRILDGSYRSVYKGKSMNFDELREYVVGDDRKDIDWKASARSQKMLVKQYIAEKKHNIMLVMDTNRRMLADTKELEPKWETALLSAGTLAYLVNQNGDYVSAIYSTEHSMEHFPFKMGLMNIENILEHYQKNVTIKNQSNIEKTLDYILRNFRRRMILIVVTDLEGIRGVSETTLKRIITLHDILVIHVNDAEATGKMVYNMEEERYLPEFFTSNKKLAKLQKERQEAVYKECEDKLKRFGIAVTTVGHKQEIDTKLTSLLHRHQHV